MFGGSWMSILFLLMFLGVFVYALWSFRAMARHVPREAQDLSQQVAKEQEKTAQLWGEVTAAMKEAIGKREERRDFEVAFRRQLLTVLDRNTQSLDRLTKSWGPRILRLRKILSPLQQLRYRPSKRS